MAGHDFAIVVGINNYPEFPPLSGAENDATDFHAWAISPKGGGVPAGNASLILSSGKMRKDARPTAEQIDEAFDELHAIARSKGRVGRRLYLFFAGHGFSPDLDETALLMANASEFYTGYHLAGRRYAQWFRTAVYFDEVVLFMDCCRRNYRKVVLREPPWAEVRNPAAGQVLFSYGFSTYWSGSAHERAFEAGRIHGLFSHTLLRGLRGEAADDNGRISSESLKSYVLNNMPAPPQDVPHQEPVFELSPTPIIFGQVARLDFPVLLRVDGLPGPLVLKDGRYRVVTGARQQQTPDGWRMRLPRGMYRVEVGEKSAVFEVTGSAREEQVVRIGGHDHARP